ncbi:DUF1614 domain-containing protein [Methanohalophilus sp.]|uniref:DUF1614 domain-containing protein n=1 Tax=Methanohalophilus sp. TaxID=1966352 RepID=UPI00260E08F6|nr:DUF1614 domain-containing protein [Methanohalophilus sp.]
MNNRMFYNPFSIIFILILTVLLTFIVTFLFMGLISTAFTRIGFSWYHALILLLLSLIGSSINIPVATIKSTIPVVRDKYVRVFGITYNVPFRWNFHSNTILAVNVGGAVIPTIVSIYVITTFSESLYPCIAATAFVAIITKIVARPVQGIGIVTPTLIPPITAALSAIMSIEMLQMSPDLLFNVAYTSGTLGTLIGADILNIGKIKDIGAPVASIGGAGTFDGVFLSGVIAVLLV